MIETSIKTNFKDLNSLPKKFQEAARNAFSDAMNFLKNRAKATFTRPRTNAGGLHIRSGKLVDSISGNVAYGENLLMGSLSSNVIYAPTHEFGATIKPKKGNYLKFFSEKAGHWVSKKQVVIPQRPFLAPVFKENAVEFVKRMEQGIISEVNK